MSTGWKISLRPYRNYKVLKPHDDVFLMIESLRPYRNYKVLKLDVQPFQHFLRLRPYRNYKVLKQSNVKSSVK